MTTRNEPTLGENFRNFFNGKLSAKSPASLVSEALQSFQVAQEQLEDAQTQIAQQVAEQQRIIAEAAVKVSEANDALSHIDRVKARIKDLIA